MNQVLYITLVVGLFGVGLALRAIQQVRSGRKFAFANGGWGRKQTVRAIAILGALAFVGILPIVTEPELCEAVLRYWWLMIAVVVWSVTMGYGWLDYCHRLVAAE